MPRVVCILPNASTSINGVRFASVEGGMLSEDLGPEMVEFFLSIRGYSLFVPFVPEEVLPPVDDVDPPNTDNPVPARVGTHDTVEKPPEPKRTSAGRQAAPLKETI